MKCSAVNMENLMVKQDGKISITYQVRSTFLFWVANEKRFQGVMMRDVLLVNP